MAEQSDKDKVLAVYPNARITHNSSAFFAVRGGPAELLSLWYVDPAQAWADAASHLPSPPVEAEPEEEIFERTTAPVYARFKRADQGQAGEARDLAWPDNYDLLCQNCGKRFGGHYGLMCALGPDASVWSSPEQHGVEMPPRPMEYEYYSSGSRMYVASDADAYMDALEAKIARLEGKAQ